MKIITSRTKCFVQAGVTLTVAPTGPQTVPEWVRTTPTFEGGVRDGSIQEIAVLSPAPVVVPKTVPQPVPTEQTESPLQPLPGPKPPNSLKRK